MVLRKALVFVGFLVGVFSTPVLAQQAGTTVIEPRLFYGATVNVENGVRVFRPLPRTRHVIINPNGAPVSLGFSEKRVYERRTPRKIPLMASTCDYKCRNWKYAHRISHQK